MSKAKEDIITILDCFSGADGGVSFVRLKVFLEECEKRNGPADKQILEVLQRFARLVQLMETVTEEKNLTGCPNPQTFPLRESS